MWNKLVLVLVAAVLVVGAVVASRPPGYRVERSVQVAAPPERVFEQVADFHRWSAWSPWAALDPGQKVDFDGPPSGQGAAYHWKGNEKVGEGRMTVTSALPPRQVVIRLQFLKPWEQVSTTTFDLAPEGSGTRVVWTMSGDFDFMGRLMTLFLDMDRQVGPSFEKGLASLRQVAEAAPPPTPPAAKP